ncbi:hypothetical protein QQZ08_008311 [Neonectria magnoliae]|uniref:Zn(2)-C6 fungal-type domain-containing protein n=1 Tax=Neonectria magnoliae TaxID=2732573 RepID=A0ABR1HUX8_9HYPO
MSTDGADLLNPATPQSPTGSSARALKRGVAVTTPTTTENRRSKRAKYAPVACNECKKKKLKCIKEDNEDACRRCVNSEAECVFASGNQQLPSRSLSRSQSQSRDRHRQVHPQQAEDRTTRQASTGRDTVGLDQYDRHRASQPTPTTDSIYRRHDSNLSDEVASLREQVATLTASLREINNRTAHMNSRSPAVTTQQNPSPVYMSESNYRPSEPRQPQFVGPTRSTFSLRVAETSLTRMGIQTGDQAPESRSPSPVASQGPSPEGLRPPTGPSQQEPDCLLTFELDEIQRLLDVYEEEVESVYPFTNIKEVSSQTSYILDYVMHPGRSSTGNLNPRNPQSEIELKDVQIVKVALATSIVIEAKGSNVLSQKLIDSVESVVCRVSGEAKIDLKEVQIMTMLVSLIATLAVPPY